MLRKTEKPASPRDTTEVQRKPSGLARAFSAVRGCSTALPRAGQHGASGAFFTLSFFQQRIRGQSSSGPVKKPDDEATEEDGTNSSGGATPVAEEGHASVAFEEKEEEEAVEDKASSGVFKSLPQPPLGRRAGSSFGTSAASNAGSTTSSPSLSRGLSQNRGMMLPRNASGSPVSPPRGDRKPHAQLVQPEPETHQDTDSEDSSSSSSGAITAPTTSFGGVASLSSSSVGGLPPNAGAGGAGEDGRGYNLQKKLPIPPGFRDRFSLPDSDSNILFVNGASRGSEETEIKGGTLCKLVEHLTLPDHGDPTFVRTFLLTYRSFTTPMELLQLMINRFYTPVTDESDLDLRRSFQKPIRLRTFAVLKVWITGYSYDFEDDPELAARFDKFCKEEIAAVMPSGSRQLLVLLEKALSREEMTKKSTPISAKEIPRPHLPTCRPSEVSMLTVHPQELARQLTLIEAKLFCAIKPWELLNLAWSRKDKEQKAPNVLAMIARSNVVTPWISSQIVSSKSLKVRAEILTRCIQTMMYLEELHNFNGIMEFIAALQNAGVWRLKETWARLDKKHKRAWDMLTARLSRDNNFKVFRESLRTVSPPSIPYLGLFLTDLTFVEEGNADFFENESGGDPIINVVKRVQYAQIIKDIQLYQQTPYVLQPVSIISDFMMVLVPMTQEQVYDVSLTIKPRGEGAKEVDDDGTLGSSANSGLRANSTGKAVAPVATDNWGDLDFPTGYPFSEADSDDNIDVDQEDHKMVLFASEAKLVERLTYEKYSDQNFVSAFLLTHRLIMPSSQLLELLIQRYNVPYPKKCDIEIKNKYEAKVVRPVRLRVFNALKQWVDKYSMDFGRDEELSKQLELFAEETMKATGMQKPGERLVEGLNAARSGTPLADKAKKPQPKSQPPVMMPRSGSVKDSPFLELPAQEVARQLTLKEFALYQGIGDREVLMWDVGGELDENFDRRESCANVCALMDHNSWLTGLTVSLIVSQDGKHASKMIEHLCLVAEQLRVMNNFNGCRAVTEGLLHSGVSSLEGAWVAVSSRAARTFDSLKDFVEEIKTFYKNQQWMQKVSAPALPSVTSYLDELARIHKALPDQLDETMHPNQLKHMAKRTQQSQTVHEFLVFQGTGFAFEAVADFWAVFEAAPNLAPEEVEANIRRLNNEVMEEDDSLGASASGKGKLGVLNRAKSMVLGSTSVESPKMGTKSSVFTSPTSAVKNGEGSPNASPRGAVSVTAGTARSTVLAAGPARRGTRSSTREIPLSSIPSDPAAGSVAVAVTQEWVESFVKAAIAEATAPLLAEIEALKQQLKAKEAETTEAGASEYT